MTAAAACVRQGGDQRRERGNRLPRAKDESPLHEEVDDQTEDGATPDELAEAHGVLPANAEKRAVP